MCNVRISKWPMTKCVRCNFYTFAATDACVTVAIPAATVFIISFEFQSILVRQFILLYLWSTMLSSSSSSLTFVISNLVVGSSC